MDTIQRFVTNTIVPLGVQTLNAIDALTQEPRAYISDSVQWLDHQVRELTKELPSPLDRAAYLAFQATPYIVGQFCLPTPIYIATLISVTFYKIITDSNVDLNPTMFAVGEGLMLHAFAHLGRLAFDLATLSMRHLVLSTANTFNCVALGSLAFYFALSGGNRGEARPQELEPAGGPVSSQVPSTQPYGDLNKNTNRRL